MLDHLLIYGRRHLERVLIEFLEHYHKRSNVETVFAMMKAKFGDGVLSRTDEGQINEVLCKVIAHNICVLIQGFYELGIEPDFGSGSLEMLIVGAVIVVIAGVVISRLRSSAADEKVR